MSFNEYVANNTYSSGAFTPSAVIFDLDGTLLDTLGDITAALNHVMETRGFPIYSKTECADFIGEGSGRLISLALPESEQNEQRIAECAEHFFEIYEKCCCKTSLPYPGIPQLLSELSDRKIPTAVLSNKPHRFTEICISELLPDWNFEVVLGHREGTPRKPDPYSVMQIVDFLDLDASKIALIGDSPVDVATAAAVGMFSVAVTWGFRAESELREAGADMIISQPDELVSLF